MKLRTLTVVQNILKIAMLDMHNWCLPLSLSRIVSLNWLRGAYRFSAVVALTCPFADSLCAAERLQIAPHIPVSVDGSRIRVNLKALDDVGQPLRDLPAERFVVSVDGRPGTITSFEKTTLNDQPLAIILAIDVSKSMAARDALANAADASERLAHMLSPSDQMCMVTFGETVKVVNDCTSDRSLFVID